MSAGNFFISRQGRCPLRARSLDGAWYSEPSVWQRWKKELQALKDNNPGMKGKGATVLLGHFWSPLCWWVLIFWPWALCKHWHKNIIYLELLNWLFLTFDCIDLSVYTLWHVPGLLRCIGKGLELCWKADKQWVLRMETSLRAFSHRPGQPFHARLLARSCSGSAFMSESKSLRHLFAKDVLEQVECLCSGAKGQVPLRAWQIQSRHIGFELSKLAHRVGGMQVREEVRLEAVKTLAHLFPSETAEPPGSSWCEQSPQHWNQAERRRQSLCSVSEQKVSVKGSVV